MALNPKTILQILLEKISHWHTIFVTSGFAPIRAAWLQHAQQGKLTVKLPRETITGIFKDIDEQGRLRLQLEDGTERAISTGDVVLPPKD